MMQRYILFLTLLLIGTSCGSSNKSRSSSFTLITLSYGGGVAGKYTGADVYSTGLVEVWERFAGEKKKVISSFKSTEDSVGFYFRYLEESGIPKLTYSRPGNMTYTIDFKTNDTGTTIQWSPQDPDVPCSVTECYRLLENFIQRH